MNVKGSYTIRQGDRILVQRTNLITDMGELFFMNRAVNNEFDPLSHIVLGKSQFRVKKSDMSLGNETFRKKANVEIDWNNKQIKLNCSCTVSEIVNTTEIGTTNGSVLISHDLYPKITNEDIGNNVDSVEITYIFDFATSSTKHGWIYYTQGDSGGTPNNIYYIVEEEKVVRVYDNLNNGYHLSNSLEALQNKQGAYYYDSLSKNLYIRTINDENPNNLDISIITE